MRIKYCLVGFISILFYYSFAAQAIEPIEPVSNKLISVQTINLELINDPEKKYSIDDIVSGNAGKFEPAIKTNFGFGYKGVMWVKMLVDFSKTDQSKLYLLEKYFHLGRIQVYQKSEAGFNVVEETEHKLLADRKYTYNSYIFDITNARKDIQVVYVRINPEHHSLRLEFEIADTKGLVSEINKSQFAYGVFFGALMILLFYNVVILLYLKRTVYLYYVYYLSSFIIVFWYLSGYAPVFVPASKLADQIFTMFGYMSIHGLLLFARHFLLLQGKLKLICKIFEYISMASIVLIFILPINPFVILNFLLIASMLFLAGAGAKRIYDGFKPAILYLTGWMAFAVSGIAYALISLGYTEISPFSKYGLMISSVWEATFFALALAYSFKLIEFENVTNLQSMLSQKNALSRTVRDFEEFKMQIGQDIHDELGQRMVALKFGATMLESNPTAENAKMISRDIINTIDKIQSEVDSILDGIRPPVLESLGFTGSIQAMVDEYRKIYSKINIQVHIAEKIDKRIEPAVQVVLFRVVQEALTNIFKHSNATRVIINIGISTTCTFLNQTDYFAAITEGALRIDCSITDNGTGFNPGSHTNGQGLSGIKNRVNELSGIFKLVSSPEKGVTLLVAIPCKA